MIGFLPETSPRTKRLFMLSIHLKWFLILLLLSVLFIGATWFLILWLFETTSLPPESVPLELWPLISFVISQNLLLMPSVYWYDKRQSKQRNRSRVPERVLHSFALFGGGVGALLGQACFRHKTQKPAFKWSAWLGVLLLGYLVKVIISNYFS